MPQSFGSIHLHYIFSTKHRSPWLTDDITDRLNGFVGGLARARKCTLTKMGGIADHVHLLVQSARDIAPSVFMAEIKAISSGWIHTEFSEAQGLWLAARLRSFLRELFGS